MNIRLDPSKRADCSAQGAEMRPLRFLAVVVFLGSLLYPQTRGTVDAPATVARQCSTSEESALRDIAERWRRRIQRGDAASVGALYREDAYYLTQHFVTGILHGRPSIQTYYSAESTQRIGIETMFLECSGDFAYTVGRYESRNAGQKAYGVNVVVLRKEAGRWLIV